MHTFLDYVDLLSKISNTAPLTEVLNLKLLRLYQGELVWPKYNVGRLSKLSILEDALKQMQWHGAPKTTFLLRVVDERGAQRKR